MPDTHRTTTSPTTSALAASWFQRYAADHSDAKKAGQEITREKTCECGRAFTQRILSERQLASAERMGLIALMQAQIPDFWVPVHCPPCERTDLGRQARIDSARAVSEANGHRRSA